jgi:hypothetical protein
MVQLRDLAARPTSISRPPPAPARTHGRRCSTLCRRLSAATFPTSPVSSTPASFPSKSHPAESAPLQSGKYGISLQRCVPWSHVPTLAAAWCRYRSPSAFRARPPGWLLRRPQLRNRAGGLATCHPCPTIWLASAALALLSRRLTIATML